MKVHEFKLLRRILKERSGIVLGEGKKDLVEAKLRPLLAELAFPTLTHLTLALMKPGSERLQLRVAQTIAVGESYFFRDKAPFKYFSEVMLPRLMERRAASRRIRIWCAATSTGQEPYSLAMLLADKAHEIDGWNIEILATDFSEIALQKASAGRYTQFEVQRGLPVSKLVRYFDGSRSGWQIKPAVRDKVIFRELNLMNIPKDVGMFDVIFCRNVLIYFDEDLRRAVLSRLARQLSTDGYLVLGSAETTRGVSRDFSPVLEGYHGIFHLAREVAFRQRHKRPLDRGPATRIEDQVVPVVSEDAKYLEVKLDRATADLLEAQAKARGLTLSELLAEFAAADSPSLRRWAGIKTGTR